LAGAFLKIQHPYIIVSLGSRPLLAFVSVCPN
jgi:hypothetical protein